MQSDPKLSTGSGPTECGQTVTYVVVGTEPERRTTYRCTRPVDHKDSHHYDSVAHLSWTIPGPT